MNGVVVNTIWQRKRPVATRVESSEMESSMFHPSCAHCVGKFQNHVIIFLWHVSFLIRSGVSLSVVQSFPFFILVWQIWGVCMDILKAQRRRKKGVSSCHSYGSLVYLEIVK
ncbi:hypothetical protein HanPSC8_Chr07g0291961 [Helianthus annuus]|nr:hypothetical protein HanIR_Chr07g0325291 [Helianthus annuus]KAJ0905263.1 hypothetical protein HanPSC8_Chr07g0291961 [Helianthus annuus]